MWKTFKHGFFVPLHGPLSCCNSHLLGKRLFIQIHSDTLCFSAGGVHKFLFSHDQSKSIRIWEKIVTLSSKGGLQDVWKKFIDSFDYRIQYNYLEYKSVDKLNAISSLFPSHCEKIFSEYCIICYISCRHLFLQQFEIF